MLAFIQIRGGGTQRENEEDRPNIFSAYPKNQVRHRNKTSAVSERPGKPITNATGSLA